MESLLKLVEEERWDEAEERIISLEQENNENVDFFILAAEVYVNLSRNEIAYSYISKGMQIAPDNYELFFMLGNYYAEKNKKQAALCYEMAVFYSRNTEDEGFLKQFYQEFLLKEKVFCSPISIIIVSFNSKEITQNCIQMIRLNNPRESYELIVIDNASNDGVLEWLEKQKDIKLIRNRENKGFAYACNQGIEFSQEGNDIFFLNNDTLVPLNAIFWLRMGLYENDKVGATGSISNYVGNGQRVLENLSTPEQWFQYAQNVNIPMKNAYEKKLWLVGFALMVKRQVINCVGGFDLSFGKGNYEDNDLGLRILERGYELLLCKNSFIFHFGSMGFRQGSAEEYNELMKNNREIMKEKWGFDITYYSYARTDIISLMNHPTTESIRVLEIGCGAGATLSRIQYLWPTAEVKGIELVERVADIGGKYLDIFQGNIEVDPIPFEKESFDYIILGDVLEHLLEPDIVIEKLKMYLKTDGCIVASIPNVQHVSVLIPLLYGSFEYKDAGILDKTHIHFFTLRSILKLMENHGFLIEEMTSTKGEEEIIIEKKDIYQNLVNLLGDNFEKQSRVYQYIFRARKQE